MKRENEDRSLLLQSTLPDGSGQLTGRNQQMLERCHPGSGRKGKDSSPESNMKSE
ncbi:hypothetical protein SAY86_021455 [Trapa natans]|uniref:Uncharacterized protein n=1 Tax=Trapa natans TaxID=22666 RepID=A0AAN7M246_TRANT|nr:hypothetical protein SAY86_021455 [Trapa natans]